MTEGASPHTSNQVRFTALPVAQGDAFLLRLLGKTILVDGGNNPSTLVFLLEQEQVTQLDIVICTHNDQDHVNGLIGLMESDVAVGELWIPVVWAELSKLVSEKNEHKEEQEDRFDTETEKMLQFINDLDARCTDDFDYADRLASYVALYSIIRKTSLRDPRSVAIKKSVPVERIVKLLRAAKGRPISPRIRMFEHGSIVGGGETWLRPMNSVEVQKVKMTGKSIWELALLSLANRQSLVFSAWTAENETCVLFCADSDMENIRLPNVGNGICTAPHHGDEKAGQKLYDEIPEYIFIRSDCKSKKRPGQSYISRKKKYCTRCQPYKIGPQSIALVLHGGKWSTTSSVCNCGVSVDRKGCQC